MDDVCASDEELVFDIDVDIEEDVAAELEHFIIIARLGLKEEALLIIENVLWKHIHHFPVFAEISSFAVEHYKPIKPGIEHPDNLLGRLASHTVLANVKYQAEDDVGFGQTIARHSDGKLTSRLCEIIEWETHLVEEDEYMTQYFQRFLEEKINCSSSAQVQPHSSSL